jgi:hypothetical protein
LLKNEYGNFKSNIGNQPELFNHWFARNIFLPGANIKNTFSLQKKRATSFSKYTVSNHPDSTESLFYYHSGLLYRMVKQ